ncbi:MAG: Integral rane sensor signal transduction histidine kinase [Pedosphaera sp.]|nr:Integral rane sensor signal transduction histidine kinase [Pedosphaera sp.]
MITRVRASGLASGFFAALAIGNLLAQPAFADAVTNLLKIRSVEVSGQIMPIRQDGEVSLGSFPGSIIFRFESNTNSGRLPIRLRYKLEGFDAAWHQGDGEMYLGVRYFNEQGDQAGQDTFKIYGESAGWNGSFQDSPLTHRREILKVPPHASRLMLVLSSAGPPATEGVYLMANLMVTKSAGAMPAVILMRSPFDQQPYLEDTNEVPHGWMRDGNHASMAKVVTIGKDQGTKAFAIFDDDPFSHAEWRSTLESAPVVTPGDDLAVEWNEMFSMGVENLQIAGYDNLMPGNYKFRVEEVDMFGNPTGAEASLSVLVPPPFWRMRWFEGAVLAGITSAVFGTWRYLAWARIRREMLQLKSQQALERERLRIAHDIHDDLGARVTQISLQSAMSVDNPAFPEKAREEFNRISRMSRELVSALYETVWAVNPENDNLDALGNYLCQMVNQLCERSQFRCRFHLLDLPREIQVSSQTRHNISMAVKEAVHNVIKHADASEVIISMALTGDLLAISVRDDGRGFIVNSHPAGNGLTNMKRRLADIGGKCVIESQPGKGTTVQIELLVKPPDK